jgi:ribosomal protein S12 methylthiotransferase accessory factor
VVRGDTVLTIASSPTPLEESLRRLETIVSPYVGIVRRVRFDLAAADDARLVSVTSELADVRDTLGGDLEAGTGSFERHRRRALAAALGEAVERYSATFLAADLVLATAEELGPEAVDPERFALFRDDQYAAADFLPQPFTRASRVRWTRGFSVPEGRPVFLPAQLVYLSGLPLAPGEDLIGYPTSNGLACRPTFDEALLAGLLEALERDAFMLTWHNRLTFPRLSAGGDRALEAFHELYVEPTGLRVEIVDLSVFHRVPTALALVHGAERDAISLTLGAACASRVREAWQKAVGEAFAVRAWARALRLADPDRVFDATFADIRTFADHVHFYALEENAEHAAFLDASKTLRAAADVPPLAGDSVQAQIGEIALRLSEIGAVPYAVDVTSPDVRAAGLRVVKAIVPELCALDAAHGARFLGGSRIYNAAYELGLRSSPLPQTEVNPYPHPFP